MIYSITDDTVRDNPNMTLSEYLKKYNENREEDNKRFIAKQNKQINAINELYDKYIKIDINSRAFIYLHITDKIDNLNKNIKSKDPIIRVLKVNDKKEFKNEIRFNSDESVPYHWLIKKDNDKLYVRNVEIIEEKDYTYLLSNFKNLVEDYTRTYDN